VSLSRPVPFPGNHPTIELSDDSRRSVGHRQLHALHGYGSLHRMDRFERQLRVAGPAFAGLIARVPLLNSPPLAPNWLRCEMLERYQLLQHADIHSCSTVLEVGAGPHAISTVPLAFELAPSGRLIASERARWNQFQRILSASRLEERVRAIACDARRLPMRDDSADLSVCLHGIRSLGSEEGIVAVVREMLRVAPRVLVAETLPLGETDAQRAHLAMYALREHAFVALGGRRDDLRYLPLERLVQLVERAGGRVRTSSTVRPDLPHALAYFPRELVESIPDPLARDDLLTRWDLAYSSLRRDGEDHPPVGLVEADRA